tara:strand:- start:3665 stop:4300 length:636 start_codon:yes stop_codon:yes gene_type:complete
MTDTNHPANLAFSLAQIQMGSAFKNAKNPFLKNKYADLTAIQNAVYPAFHANGFAIMQLPGKDEMGDYVRTVFTHVSGTVFCGTVYLEYKSGDMQSKGGAITYARRYGLAAISGVPVEDDDGNAATGRNSPNASSSAPKELPSTPPTQKAQVSPVHRGVRFVKFIENASMEELSKQLSQGLSLIEEVREQDHQFAAKIETALDVRKSELGM